MIYLDILSKILWSVGTGEHSLTFTSSLQMSQSTSPIRKCRSRKCESARLIFHAQCVAHCDCVKSLVYKPEECEVCLPLVKEIQEFDQEKLEESSAWNKLSKLLGEASNIINDQKSVKLCWPSPGWANIFPQLSLSTPTKEDEREEEVTEVQSEDADSLRGISKILQQIFDNQMKDQERGKKHKKKRRRRYSSSDSSSSSQSSSSEDEQETRRSRKRRRHRIYSTSDDEFSQAVPDEATGSSSVRGTSQAIGDKEGGFQRQQDQTVEGLCNLGWLPIPKHWKVCELLDKSLAAFHTINLEGEEKFEMVKNVELKQVEFRETKSFVWRTMKGSMEGEEDRPFRKIKGMASALASISTLVQDSSTSIKLGDIKPYMITLQAEEKQILSSGQAYEDIIKWWKAKANNSSAQPPSSNNGNSVKFNIVWPKGSENENMSKFLGGGKIGKSDFPDEFRNDAKLITADNKARSLANQAWQVSAVLELLQDCLKAITKEVTTNKEFDNELAWNLVSKVVSGAKALMEPHTQLLIEDSVEKRLEVRSEAIPGKLKAIQKKVMSADPLCPKPCGSSETLQHTIDSMPQPMTLNLPSEFYKMMEKNNEQKKTYKPNWNYKKDKNYRDNRYNNKNYFRKGKDNYKNKRYDGRYKDNQRDKKYEGNKGAKQDYKGKSNQKSKSENKSEQ